MSEITKYKKVLKWIAHGKEIEVSLTGSNPNKQWGKVVSHESLLKAIAEGSAADPENFRLYKERALTEPPRNDSIYYIPSPNRTSFIWFGCENDMKYLHAGWVFASKEAAERKYNKMLEKRLIKYCGNK